MGVEKVVNKVLVLDDDPVYSLLKMLEDLGYEHILTESVQEAKEKEKKTNFYAAILDRSVPMVKGGPAYRRAGLDYALDLKKRKPHIKVALHTSLPDYDEELKLKPLGIGYLSKPARKEELIEFLG